jgi:hypothetical protein
MCEFIQCNLINSSSISWISMLNIYRQLFHKNNSYNTESRAQKTDDNFWPRGFDWKRFVVIVTFLSKGLSCRAFVPTP